MKKIYLFLVLLSMLLVPAFAFSTMIPGIDPFTVTANGMDGMLVDVTFGDGLTLNNLSWADIGGPNSGQSGVGDFTNNTWSLTNNKASSGDDTSMNPWILTSISSTTGISSITIDAISAGIVFDIIQNNPNNDTLGSKGGWWDGNDMTVTDPSGTTTGTASSGSGFLTLDSDHYFIDINATSGVAYSWSFSDKITVDGQSTVSPEDVWGKFTLNFGDPFITKVSGNNPNTPLVFSLDTDAVVPEPATLFLFGLGLIGMCGVIRKKIKIA